MNNDIFSKQNKNEYQKLIVAQHFVYRNAKVLTLVLLILSVFVPIGLDIGLMWIKDNTVITIFSFISICIVIICEIIRDVLSNKKLIAAQIQQMFDIGIFGLESGFCLDEEVVNVAVEKYKDLDWERKKDWYPDYRKLDKNKAIFYCQKENIDWNNNLSSKYNNFLIVSFVVMIIIMIVNFIIADDSISHILSIVLVALPLLTYCYSGYRKIKNDNRSLSAIKEYSCKIEAIIKENGSIDSRMLENLQWMIFNYRKEKYLIPDWFDKLFYKEIQEIEKSKAAKIKKKNN